MLECTEHMRVVVVLVEYLLEEGGVRGGDGAEVVDETTLVPCQPEEAPHHLSRRRH
jgi:hypothetical protein